MLLFLIALTALYVGGEVWDDAVAVSVLAELKSLQEMGVCDAPQLTDQGLLAFAALTGLTKLCLLSCGLGEAMPRYLNGKPATEEDEEEGYFIVWTQEHLPAVWLQLLQLLATHS
ncbi:hypothetical protein OEZ86_013668 [Tetradesmus obliquus]|nr:hypothetical protein OEZ86_013668 [Tetradesmus obliquus]